MKKLLLTTSFIAMMIPMALMSQISFERWYGGEDEDWGTSVQQTQDGGYIITGYTGDYNHFDVYLIKTDALGNEIWSRTYGGEDNDEGHYVQQTRDGGYIIVGNTNSFGAGYKDIYLIKTDSLGNESWSQTYGGESIENGYSVQQTWDGGYIIGGDTHSFGDGGDIYLIKTNSLGNEIWSQTYGGDDVDHGGFMQLTQDGGYIVAGTTNSFGAVEGDFYLIKTDSLGNESWSQTYGSNEEEQGTCVQQTQDGGYIIGGITGSPFASDIFIVKVDSLGNDSWSGTYDDDEIDWCYSVQQDRDGGYIIGGNKGSYYEGIDLFLFKIDYQGNESWFSTFGGDELEMGGRVQLTQDGGYILVGMTMSYGEGDGDVYLVKTPPSLSKWTILVYLNADNNLEACGIDDFLEMDSIGSSENVNIVVQFDRAEGHDSRYGDWTTTKRFYVTEGMDPTPENALSDLGELDMGNPETLAEFGAWGVANYPAENYMLIVWDHGDGWYEKAKGDLFRAVCNDESSGNAIGVADGELNSALSQISGSLGRKLDIIDFDCCLMGMAEVMYECKDYFDIMIGSEATVPCDGLPYDTWLGSLVNSHSGIMTPEGLSIEIVQKYIASYSGGSQGMDEVTLSAVDLADPFSALVEKVDLFAAELMCNRSEYQVEIQAARGAVQDYDITTHVDLYHFAELIYNSTGGSLQYCAHDLMLSINDAVLENGYYGAVYENSHGIATYYPADTANYNTSYDTLQLGYAESTLWDEFIRGKFLNPDFTTDITSGCATLTVNFMDLSTSLDSIVSWQWDFGDGTDSTYFSFRDTIVHAYQDTGIYTVSLTVTDENGFTCSVTGEDYIDVFVCDWTVLVYLNADNNLETCGINDLIEMASVGSDENVNIVVQFDRAESYDSRYGDWTTTKRFYVAEGMDPTPENALSDLGEMDMGDPGTLADFGAWGVANYPAENYMLIVWDHGDGWYEKAKGDLFRAVCNDESSGNAIGVADGELNSALSQIKDSLGRKLDIIDFDCCLMGMAEVMYECKDYFDIMIGSEATVPCDGLPYDKWLGSLVNSNNGNMTPAGLSIEIVQKYIASYSGGSQGTDEVTLSAVDLADTFSVLVEKVDIFAADLICNRSEYQVEIQAARATVQNFNNTAHVDLYHFAELINNSTGGSLQNSAQDLMISINDAVLENGYYGAVYENSHGIAIYYPADPAIYNASYHTLQLGFADSTLWDEYISGVSLYVDFTANKTSGCSPLTVNFTDLSTTSDSIVFWYWDFGDGNNSSLQNPTHIFDDPGVYTVSLTITTYNNMTCTKTITDYITVYEVPVIEFSATPTTGIGPLTVQFTDQSTPGTGTIDEWSWDFGDGNSSTLQHPMHIFEAQGTYTVSLTVTNSYDCMDTKTKEDYINVLSPLLDANFIADKTSGCVPLTVEFTDLSTGSPTSWEWDFQNDGIVDSYIRNPEWVNTEAGTFTVSLKVTDINASTDTETKENYMVVYEEPTANFTSTPTAGCDPLTVHFSDQSIAGAGANVSWFWDFGDGHSSHLKNPTHTYENPDTYTIKLTVTNEHGCTDVKTRWNYITVYSPPEAEFSANPTTGIASLTVQFSDQSTPGTGAIDEWSWDFGDGNSSTIQNPAHIYETPGTFTVSLIVTTSNDCTDTETKVDYITVSTGEAHFNPVWTAPYNPMTFYIISATINDADMQPGDEVGLFDIDPNTSEEICVGSGVLTQPLIGSEYLEIIASMDDGMIPGQANGFTPGHTILYRLWNETTGEVTNVSSNYPYPGYDEVYTSQGSAFVELAGVSTVTQVISFVPAWNIISFRVEPENMDLLDIVQPLIDEEALYKVLDEDGGTIFLMPFPPPIGQWTNTIGNMIATEGYYVKLDLETTLQVSGNPVVTPLNIPLHVGWNIIAYPCQQPQDALAAVQPLIDAGILCKVLDESGGTIFHLPIPPPNGQWTNTIGNLESGKGYYVNVSGEAILTLGCPTGKQALSTYIPEKIETSFFQPVFENNPYMPMNVILLPDENLVTGDEIGIFDGDVCVGATVFNGITDQPIFITVSTDDPYTEWIDGFISGNNITAKSWSTQTNQISNIEIELIEGISTFAPLETCVGSIAPLLTDLIEFPDEMFNVKVQPNPFKNSTNVVLSLHATSNVKISIMNLSGVTVKQFHEQTIDKGQKVIKLNAIDMRSGVYTMVVEFTHQDRMISKFLKVVII